MIKITNDFYLNENNLTVLYFDVDNMGRNVVCFTTRDGYYRSDSNGCKLVTNEEKIKIMNQMNK